MAQFLLEQSRQLRRHSTPHEQKLWYYLRGRRFESLKFNRQCVLGPYIVDFYCREHRLIIELDGGGHDAPGQRIKDVERDHYFVENKYRVVRIWNTDIDVNIEGVLEHLQQVINTPSP